MSKLDYEHRGAAAYGVNRKQADRRPQGKPHMPSEPLPIKVIDTSSGEVVGRFSTRPEAHAFIAQQSFGLPTALEVRD